MCPRKSREPVKDLTAGRPPAAENVRGGQPHAHYCWNPTYASTSEPILGVAALAKGRPR